MFNSKLTKNSLEILEARIAPAAVAGAALPTDNNSFVKATLGAPVLVTAGQVLNTTGVANDGSYLLFVEKGSALVFFTDLNGNSEIDYNEITGISAGDGLRMVCFTDIHGDIVTNLRETPVTFPGPGGTPIQRTVVSLSDSDSNPSNDSTATRGDGRVLLNSTIEKIEMRSLRPSDVGDQDKNGVIDDADVSARKIASTYSIFGNIYAGGGFGAADGGLLIDATGGLNFGFELIPTFGTIKVGTAASGEFFSFGASRADDTSGTLTTYTPARGEVGGSITGVRAIDVAQKFLINGLYAGDGGFGAKGGDIKDIVLNGDDSGGYEVIAGRGGSGLSGGAGGSIVNFSDLGSSTSKIVIRSGDGGVGSTGAGGAGGGFTFDTFNVRGNVGIELGNGGDGFSRGGDGASLAKGNFTQPDPTVFTPGNGYGTTHLPSTYSETNTDGEGSYVPRFGSHAPVDFDGDGFGDFVYTTRGTSQLVVMFGDGLGGFRYVTGPDGLLVPDRMYLSGVRNAEALTVGDFNGDGRPDIAVASIDEGSHTGIVTFLSKYEHEGPGAPTGSEDLNGNGENDFLGFTTGRFSALPLLSTAGYAEASIQVSSLAAGDFDGDGRPELAVIATYYEGQISNNGVIIGVDEPNQVLLFMTADSEVDNLTGNAKLTGTFYADFGTKGSLTEPAMPRVPYLIIADENSPGGGLAETVVINATALSNTAKFDVLLVGIIGGKEVNSIAFAAEDLVTGDVVLRPAPVSVGTYALGRVDTNRQTGANDITETDFLLGDFTVFDYDDDKNADIAAISQSPEGFLVGVKGTGTGGGTQVSSDAGTLQNAGNWFGGQDGYDIGTTLHAIRAVDADGDGLIDDVAILHNNQSSLNIALIEFLPGAQGAPLLLDLATGARAGSGAFFFDVHHTVTEPDPANPILPGFGNSSLTGANEVYFSTSLVIEPLYEVGLKILAGDGGDSSVGNGGKGGSLGGGAQLIDVVDPETGVTAKELQGSLNFLLSGDLRLFAGAGGNGFANGGAGGDVTGVTLRYRNGESPGPGLGASLAAGDGGRGVTGKGGSGGDINNVSIQTSVALGMPSASSMTDQVFLEAGNGGSGAIGGTGGNVLGNKTIIADAITSYLDVRGGQGGEGIKRGGDGGTVRDLAPSIRIPIAPTDGAGTVYYLGGDGGNAVSGRGGNGGSVLDNSPRTNAYISGEVYLRGGDAGSGTVGGNGGTVRNFNVTITSKETQAFTAIAGHGGSGSVGNGGKGGDIIDITVPSRGVILEQTVTNRVLAGNGGASAGAKGGNGGSLTDVTSSAQDGAFALVAGAGGAGLTVGGKGGSVVKNSVSIGAGPQAKILIAAGAGGDATAFLPNKYESLADQEIAKENAFGGTIGRGGAGGSIINFKQLGSTGAHVDLIGGNGGSTLNYGSVLDEGTPFVGPGGSIKTIRVRGDIGNVQVDRASTAVDENVPIKSYNNIFAGETMASYVETMLRNSSGAITDADGNVGVVVGSAGRNKATASILNPDIYTSQPANNSINGSLIDVTANNLMSAVAGNVDRIAAIQMVKGLKILGGQIGVDKGSYVADRLDPEMPDASGANKGAGRIGEFDYLQQDSDSLTPRDPVRDGALIDGAVFALSILDDAGRPIKLAGRVYDI